MGFPHGIGIKKYVEGKKANRRLFRSSNMIRLSDVYLIDVTLGGCYDTYK